MRNKIVNDIKYVQWDFAQGVQKKLRMEYRERPALDLFRP